MDRAKKTVFVDELHQTFASPDLEAIVVILNKGVVAGATSDFRVQSRKHNVDYKVSKNRLVLRALKGTRFEGIGPMLKGPVGIATSKDPVAAAKIAATFAKTNDKFVIIGGALGDKILDKAAIEALSKLPSLDELRGTIAGMLKSPARAIATIAAAPASQVARVIGAYAQKG